MISVLASQPQYLAHIQPIWDALPDDLKGEVLTGPAPRGTLSEWVIVAGGPDSRRARRSKVVWVEHGAGQSYRGDPRTRRHSNYVGGIGHDHVRLFLAPSEAVAAIWRLEYPKAHVEAIGCPRLDMVMLKSHWPRGTVAMSWHWDLKLNPETRSALPEYNRALPGIIAELRDDGYEVIGHSHPRADLQARYKVLDIEYVDLLDEVFNRAEILMVDNSSAGFEAAALGLGTVWLNASYYRRNMNHGLRFWNRLPGPCVDKADQVMLAFDLLKEDRPWWEIERQYVVDQTYAYTDGSSTQRAVDAILDTILN